MNVMKFMEHNYNSKLQPNGSIKHKVTAKLKHQYRSLCHLGDESVSTYLNS